MSDEAQAQQASPPQPGSETRENFVEAWKRASVVAEALERGEEPPPPEAPEAAEAKGEEVTEEAPEPKQEAKAKLAKTDDEPDVEDKNEGAVAVAERRKFRQQKRELYEKVEAERRELAQQRAAAEQYFGPFLKAKKMAEDGDIDGALKEAFGLDYSEVTKRVLKRESSKDPRVDKLEREAAELRRQVQQREEAERRAIAERQDAQARQEWIESQAAELEQHEQYGELAKNGWMLQGIYAVQKEHWDGHETVSAEEAAAEYLERLQRDPAAREVYETLSRVFGSREAATPEGQKPAVRGSKAHPARSGGKAPPKSFSQRSAAEASAPDRIKPDDPMRDIKLRNKYAAQLESASD